MNEVDRLLAQYGRNFPEFERQEERLEQEHYGEFAVFHDGELIGVYATSEEADAKGAEVKEPGEFAIFKIGKKPLRYAVTV